MASLSLPVRDPVRAHVAAKRQAAQKKLARIEKKGVSDMTPGRARELLHQLRAYLAFLARTDPVAGYVTSAPTPRLWTGEAVMEHALEVAGVRVATDGIPDRAERERLIGPVLAQLEKLARRAPPVSRKRKQTPTTKEKPMPTTSRCVVPNHPHHPSGCVVDDPHAKPPPPPPPGDAMPEFPLALRAEIFVFEGIFRVPNPEAVRKQRALDLTRRVLDYPERERVSLVAALLYRLAMPRAR